MPSDDYHLLDEIRRDALDSSRPVADTLRKLIALGSDAGSTELREWARQELRGYRFSDIPQYRRPHGSLLIDAIKGNIQITGQEISPKALPSFAHDVIKQEVPLGRPVGQLEAMMQESIAGGGSVRIPVPRAQELAAHLNAENDDPFQRIQTIYWHVSTSTLAGVIDQIRTALVELVTEIRAHTPSSTVPLASVADRAVNVVIHGDGAHVNLATEGSFIGDQNVAAEGSTVGDQNVVAENSVIRDQNVGTLDASVGNQNAIDVDTTLTPDEPPSPWRRVGTAAVSLATVAGAVFGLAQWQGWSF